MHIGNSKPKKRVKEKGIFIYFSKLKSIRDKIAIATIITSGNSNGKGNFAIEK